MTVAYQEKFITLNGVRLRYLDWGTEGNTPLICMHGHAGQAHIWDEFAEAMSPHYHVYTLDQRGHGGSGWAVDGYARDRFVLDLAAFTEALGIQKCVLAGLSMGGWNALLYADAYPDNVERHHRRHRPGAQPGSPPRSGNPPPDAHGLLQLRRSLPVAP